MISSYFTNKKKARQKKKKNYRNIRTHCFQEASVLLTFSHIILSFHLPNYNYYAKSLPKRRVHGF